MQKYHHYCRGRVATQYCSFTRKKKGGEWMATHAEEHFSSLRKLSDVVDHFVRKQFESFWFSGGDPERLNLEIY